MSVIHRFGHDDVDRWQEFINDRGNESWELVSVTHKTVPWPDHSEPGDQYTLFFKRPL
jgi:hypothetical protein